MQTTQDNLCHVSSAVEWLHYEYTLRNKRNSLFSLRAFARYLGIQPGPLSEILSAKRTLTPRQALHIAERMGLNEFEKEKLLALVKQKKPGGKKKRNWSELPIDSMGFLMSGSHLPLLSLMETEDFRFDLKWISKRLGISRIEIRQTLECLRALGMIQKQNGKWIVIHENSKTPNIPSEAIREFHRRSLKRTLDDLDSVPRHLRDVTSITLAIDPAKLDQARLVIQQFRKKMAALLETDHKTEVYQLSIQLMPISKKETP